MPGELDCTDVGNLVDRNRHDVWQKFHLVFQLTIWELGCLNLLKDSKNRGLYPKEQEEKLFNRIKRELINIKPDLILLDVKNLKYIGVILQDYKVGGDVEFNKFLVRSLLQSYGSIANNVKHKLRKKFKSEEWKEVWKKAIPDMEKDGQIKPYLGPQSTPTKKPKSLLDAKVEKYLNLRKDVDSLYTIISQFKELNQELKQSELDAKEFCLALQRLFHVAGEYVKDTPSTPNLSDETRKSLMDLGVPVKQLSDFRDMLAHHQLFPLIELNIEGIEKLLENDFLPIKKIMENKISELEESYIRDVIEEKLSGTGGNSELKQFFEKCLEDSKKGVGELLKSIKNSKSTSSDVVDLSQKVLRMKSKDPPIEEKQLLGRNIGRPISDFIVESKLEMYRKLHKELESWKNDYNTDLGSLLEKHEYVLEMIKVMDHLSYGTSSISEETLEDFIGAKEFDEMFFKSEDGGSTLKNEFKKYFDPNEFSNYYDWSIPEKTTLEHITELLGEKGKTVEGKKILDFLKALYNEDSKISLTVNEYKQMVDNMKLSKPDAAKLHSFSVDWKKKECARLLEKHCSSDLKNVYDAIIQGNMELVPEKYEVYIPHIRPHVKELYDSRVREEINVLGQLENPNAVESQIVNIYSLLDNAQEKPSKIDGSAEAAAVGSKETFDNAKGKDDIKKFRNYLSHGDALTNTNEKEELSEHLIVLKDKVVSELREIIDFKDSSIDIPKIESILDGVELSKGILNIKEILCPKNWRIARNINGCLTWEDIEKVVDGKMETVDPDIIEIDSEKFMSVLSEEMSEAKFYNYIALAGESEVEGALKNEVDGLITHHETYIKHLEKVGKFSGAVMHGMIAKDILRDIIKGNYKGVAIDLGFFGGSIVVGKLAEFVAKKGAGFAAKGSVFLGKSMQLASPFLARGASAFVVYDLWNEVKEFKAGNKDAIVSIVGDSIQLAVDAAEVGIEIAEGLAWVEGVSATTGPIGMAIGVTIFVGVEVYKAVRAVEKINDKIHLTGWERFVQGLEAFVGMSPSKYLQDLMDEIDGNNAAVKSAIKVLKENPHILRYVFPSYVHVDGKLVSALNSVVQLSEKVYNIKWTRSRPDDVAGINLFCKPSGDWESAPGTGTYKCENAIGVEYTDNRTGNYTLINLGEGDDWVTGFQDSGNIFIINEAHKTIFGGNKDDNFIFQMEGKFNSKINGSIDGLGGLNTVDVGGLPFIDEFGVSSRSPGMYSLEELIADFSTNLLTYGNSVRVSMYNINKYQGKGGSRDLVKVACNTLFVDGRGGGEELKTQDEVSIPDDKTCTYKTTIVVNSNTCITNDAALGKFNYFINGKQGEGASINLSTNSAVKNMLTFKYSINDMAAIERSGNNTIKFSFVEKFYESVSNLQFSNSFNLTISGGVEDNIYLLSDNTRVVVGKNKLYALQNTGMSIDSIVREYTYIMNKLQMIAIVHSKNQVLTIGGLHNDVLSNDPNADVSHFVSGDGDNIFSFISGREKLSPENLPINFTVIHYSSMFNSIDTLDLRKIKGQVKKDFGNDMAIAISKYGDDLSVNLFFDGGKKSKLLMTIFLKDVVLYHWYHKIRLMLDAPFVIQEHKGEFRLVPEPLIFNDKSSTLYVITPRDVVEGMRIKVAKELRSYDFVRDGDALIITNSLSSDAYTYPLATITLNDFYNKSFRDKMETLEIEFEDETFSLSEETERINSAQDFVELKQKVRVDTHKTVMTAMKRTQGLFEAISQGQIQLAKDIIDADGSILYSYAGWINPLAYAATKGQIEVVTYLVQKGIDITQKDSSGHTPIYYALKNQHEKVASFLLFAEGERGLITATGEVIGVKFIAKLLKECHDCSRLRNSLMHYAVMNGNEEVVKYLIEEGAEDGLHISYRTEDENGYTMLYYAVKYRHAGVVEYLDKIIRNSEGEGMTLLCFAAQIGSLDIIKYLIEQKGADIFEKDKSSHTPMYYALENGNEDVIDYMSKLIVREGEGQLLSYAVISEDISTMRQFITRGASVNGKNNHGKTPLHYAAIYCNVDMVKLLIDANADIYAKDSSDHTPVYYALSEMLLYGVRPDPTCNRNSLLLHLLRGDQILSFAAKAGELEIVETLITGADYNTKYYQTQQTLLHLAVLSQNLQLIAFLREGSGLDPNEVDIEGQTPLHYACKIGSLKIVKYLDEHGADCRIRDKRGRTPPALAPGHPEIFAHYYFQGKCVRRKRDAGGSSLQPRMISGNNGQAWHESNATGIQQSSWLHNGILSWMTSSLSGVLNSTSNEKTTLSQIGSQIDANGTMLLLDLLIRKATGQKHVSTVDREESPLDIQGYALNVVELFEEVLNDTAVDLGISVTRLNFDPLAMQSTVIRYRRYGKTSDIPTMMLSFAKKACPDSKQTDEFLKQFIINLERVLEDNTEPPILKVDQISNPIFSNKYGVVMRVVEADVARVVGGDPFNSLNGTSEMLKLGNV